MGSHCLENTLWVSRMREIKFRYRLRSTLGQEVFTKIITLDELETDSEVFLEQRWGSDFNNYNIVSRDQFTGLHDKKGKEIYDGDIVSDGGDVCEVKWLPVGMYNICPLTDKKEWQKTIIKNFKNLEVIGNIHENPELLK